MILRGLFKLNIALAVLVVLKTPTCSILNCGLLYKTNSTTNSTHKEKKTTLICYVNAILTPSDFKRCLRPISPYFFVTVASRSCISFLRASLTNFSSSVRWRFFAEFPLLSHQVSCDKCPPLWIDTELENGRLIGLKSKWQMDK